MEIITKKLCELDTDLANPVPLFEPDMGGEFGLRYIWLQHRFDNENFTKNYFNEGNTLGLNLRKITVHLVEEWKKHNLIFETGRQTGDLIWRVKVYNHVTKSIDHIEVWRSVDTIVRLFEANRYKEESHLRDLGNGLYESGFSNHFWYPYPTISRKQAEEVYSIFKDMHIAKENCSIDSAIRLPNE